MSRSSTSQVATKPTFAPRRRLRGSLLALTLGVLAAATACGSGSEDEGTADCSDGDDSDDCQDGSGGEGGNDGGGGSGSGGNDSSGGNGNSNAGGSAGSGFEDSANSCVVGGVSLGRNGVCDEPDGEGAGTCATGTDTFDCEAERKGLFCDGDLCLAVNNTFFSDEQCPEPDDPEPSCQEECSTSCDESPSQDILDECYDWAGCGPEDCSPDDLIEYEQCIETQCRVWCDDECYEESPEEAPPCIYANVTFTLTSDGESVTGLSPDDVALTVDGRELGVETSEDLSSNSGLLVQLLLDGSYSIVEAEAEQDVVGAATDFLNELSDEAYVNVATFASEEVVPTFLCSDGSSGIGFDGYSSKEDAKAAVAEYAPHQSLSSWAQTKVHDAAVRLSNIGRPSTGLMQLLPRVMVVFTDGADNNSVFKDPQEARERITDHDPDLMVYAVGLGDDVKKAALDTLSQDKTFLASDSDTLSEAFVEVADQLRSIHRLRILVGDAKENADAVLLINHGGETVAAQFRMGYLEDASPLEPPGQAVCNDFDSYEVYYEYENCYDEDYYQDNYCACAEYLYEVLPPEC